MENQFQLDGICRLCLSTKSHGSMKIFSEITEIQRDKFESVTQTKVSF